jgi:hypothetical protein
MFSSFQIKIRNLPNEIQHIILSYSYSPQKPIILEDIKVFHQSLDVLYDYINEFQTLNNYYFITSKDEIHNELFDYVYYNICDGTFESLNTHFFCRSFMYNANKSYYYLFNESNSLDSQIRTIWGLFTNEERYDFIDYISNEMVDFDDDSDEEDFDF